MMVNRGDARRRRRKMAISDCPQNIITSEISGEIESVSEVLLGQVSCALVAPGVVADVLQEPAKDGERHADVMVEMAARPVPDGARSHQSPPSQVGQLPAIRSAQDFIQRY